VVTCSRGGVARSEVYDSPISQTRREAINRRHDLRLRGGGFPHGQELRSVLRRQEPGRQDVAPPRLVDLADDHGGPSLADRHLARQGFTERLGRGFLHAIEHVPDARGLDDVNQRGLREIDPQGLGGRRREVRIARLEVGEHDLGPLVEHALRHERPDGPDAAIPHEHEAGGHDDQEHESRGAAQESVAPGEEAPGRKIAGPVRSLRMGSCPSGPGKLGGGSVRAARLGRWLRNRRRPGLEDGGGQHDRKADEQKHDGEREHPVGQPHVLLHDIDDLEDDPGRTDVHGENLP
jgi:hypothetical protein